jgi:hypothetical protein
VSNDTTPKVEVATPPAFITKDMRLAVTLVARGHRVLPGGITKDASSFLWFSFPHAEVKQDVQDYRVNKPLEFDIHKALYAYNLFTCALHGIHRDKQTIICLMTLGNDIKDNQIVKDGKLLQYFFEGDKAKQDASSFLEFRPIEVKHTDFWNAQDFFRANIHRKK